ncbi:AI-2E family transporter [Neobacillus notoginsengisoli]|uniref:AI-2E family transporter n=1 Tax=Neobacillus notoginsengisoli TaxID=1578198 RepID=A0A417YTT7_9BACI|nr:AI-2E family transporter [Neobacillus notoginsengisoli]RHW40591.1 AI-2E family transporter [Neobacillus notoginsengisoli]
MNIHVKWYYRIGFFLLLLATVYILMKLKPFWSPAGTVIWYILVPFIAAGFIAYLLHPLVEKLNARGLHRGLAVLLIYIVFFGGLGYGVYKGVPAFIEQIRELSSSAPAFAEQYRDFISSLEEKTKAWPVGIQERMDRGITNVEEKLIGLFDFVLAGLANLADSILVIAVIPFIAFYMLKDYELIKRTAWYLTPKKWRRQGVRFLSDVNESLGGYIRGQLLVCVIVGLVSSLLFWFFGLRFPLLLGLVVALTNVIPYFGPIFGAIPAVFIAATMSTKLVFITLGIVFVLQFIEGNVLSPYIVGKSLHMHPLLIMFSIVAGSEIGGIPGLILAVPILAVTKVAIVHGISIFAQGRAQKE